ncbi:MAG: translocase [Deferribacteres bacterium]|nr:translocase [candidate division KSB1 bacterium]MCB9509492.1 translocase [Deferribacteres bacterium]
MQKSALERFLGLFTDVRPGEGLTALMLATNIFLILTAYYIIKPVREGLILSGSGPEVKSYLAAVLVIVLIGTVKLFAWLAGRFSRKPLINIVTLFFVVCLAIFYFLGKFGLPYLDVIFFVWIGMFNVMIPAQFWGFANDIYTPDAGKRLMVLVAFGSNLGAIVGAKIASYLVGPVGLFELMLVAGGVLAISLLFTNAVDAREKSQVAETDQSDRSDEEPLGKEGAFKLVFQTKYLLMIALLILLLNWVNTTGEYILGRVVGGAADAAIAAGSAGGLAKSEYIGKFYADFFSIVNLGSVLIQLFLVSRILKYFGVGIAILILPLIAMFGYMVIAFVPILTMVRWVKTAENATDYSLQNTVRHVLFLPTSREQKYKAKQAIDSFFHRAGDVLSAAVVFVGVNWLALKTTGFAAFNLFLVVIWLVLAVMIGRENKRWVERREAEKA